MSNNPFNISAEGLSPELAAAVATLTAALTSRQSENAAYAGAQSLAEAVEKLRILKA